MAHYCKQCGSPLVDGRCPRCQPAPPPRAGGIGAQVAAFYRSGDVLRLIPASGYAVLALVWLVRVFCSLLGEYPGALLNWLELLACAAVAVELAGGGKNAVRVSVAALLGLMALLNLGTLLANGYFGYNYTTAALVVLLCGIWRTSGDGRLRLGSLAVGAVLVAALFLSTVGVQLTWLVQLALCAGLLMAFLHCMVDSSKGR